MSGFHGEYCVVWRHVTPCIFSLRLSLNEKKNRLYHNYVCVSSPTAKLVDGFSLNLATALSVKGRRTSAIPSHLLQVITTWQTGELETGETVNPLTLKSL